MTATAGAASLPSFAQRSLVGEALAAWRGITAEQLIGAVLLGLAACTPTVQQLVRPLGVSAAWPEVSYLMASSVIKALCLLLAVVLADRAVDREARRTRAYVMAVVAGVVIGSTLHWAWVMFLSDLTGAGYALGEKMKVNPMLRYTFLANSIFDWLIIGGLAVFIYADRRDGQKILANLHAAQVERSTQARQMLESRLQAMQARVEPRFLFNTLARIKQLYDANAALGDRMLDDLIVYLRAAMPRMRDSSSTLAREIELARAYLNILEIQLTDRFCFAIDVPDGIGEARFPPMMLLPLIDHAMWGDEISNARFTSQSGCLAPACPSRSWTAAQVSHPTPAEPAWRTSVNA